MGVFWDGSELGGIGGQEEKGTTEDEMAGWHHGLDGRESEWTLGVGDGQGGLVCCDSWGRKESDTDWATQLNWTETLVISLFKGYLDYCTFSIINILLWIALHIKKKSTQLSSKWAKYWYTLLVTKEDVQIQQDLKNIHLENANLKPQLSTSLMARWLGIHLPMQKTWVQTLVQEDSRCCEATKPWVRLNYWARDPQLPKPEHSRACAPQQEQPPRCEAHTPCLESSLHSTQLEKAHLQQCRPSTTKNK